jgi:hypothetical protein
MGLSKLFGEQLDELVERHGNNSRYFWKILHLIKLKYSFPIICRGASSNTIAFELLSNPEYKKQLSKRDIDVIENIIKKGATEIDERKRGVDGGYK